MPTDPTPPAAEPDWRMLLGIGIVAGDVSVAAIARYAGVTPAQAARALDHGRLEGVVGEDGQVDERTGLALVADLPVERVAETHLAVARRLFAEGPSRVLDVVAHARKVGTAVALHDLVPLADHGGQVSLSLGDYASAHQLLGLVAELDTTADLAVQGRRLLDLAAACDGIGQVAEARRHLARAVSIGELIGDASLVARAAARYALPADWYSGDALASALLQRAEAMDLTEEERVLVRASRAFVEIRIPLALDAGQQVAWITRASVAREIADEALAKADACGPDVRGLALLAWRNTHRAPQFLDRRRTIATEALDLFQKLRDPSQQIESAIFLAVDALESGDRALFDQALGVARWAADRDGNPRLRWRALTLAAGAAHLDDDLDLAIALRRQARDAGEPIGLPGWLGADLLFWGEEMVRRDDPEEMATLLPMVVDESFVGLLNPIGRAVVTYLLARLDRLDEAERHARLSLRMIDEESSMLLLASLLTRSALLIGDRDLQQRLLDVLAPWVGHNVVDSNGWWCDGPVSLWTAELHRALGDLRSARTALAASIAPARALDDLRSLRRIDALRAHLGTAREPADRIELTNREREVLALLAHGATNPEIARRLSYSVSTVRNDTVSIYRTLGVKGRADAVRRAVELGLIDETDVRH